VTLTYDMPDAEYRALPGLSGTGVVKLLRSPALYRHSVDNPTPATDAMRLGTLFHALALGTYTPEDDPFAFEAPVLDDVVVAPFENFRTAEAREWRDAQQAKGIKAVSRDVHATMVKEATERYEAALAKQAEWHAKAAAMVTALYANPDAAAILNAPGNAEVTITWTHDGHAMKGRIDWVTDDRQGRPRAWDLKSISVRDGDDFLDACHKDIGTRGYHVQVGGHYSLGLALATDREVANAGFIFVESTVPYRVAVIVLSDYDHEAAWALRDEAYRRYADCLAADVWPDGSPEGVQTSRIPTWAARNWDRAMGVDTAADTIAALEQIIGG
jgi:hypothetical protein